MGLLVRAQQLPGLFGHSPKPPVSVGIQGAQGDHAQAGLDPRLQRMRFPLSPAAMAAGTQPPPMASPRQQPINGAEQGGLMQGLSALWQPLGKPGQGALSQFGNAFNDPILRQGLLMLMGGGR